MELSAALYDYLDFKPATGSFLTDGFAVGQELAIGPANSAAQSSAGAVYATPHPGNPRSMPAAWHPWPRPAG